MLRHLEPAAGDHGCIVTPAEEFIEPLRVSAGPSRKRGEALGDRSTVKIRALGSERLEQSAIVLKQSRIVADDVLQFVESNAGQSFGRVSLVNAEQVVQSPHSFGEVRLREDPAAPQ